MRTLAIKDIITKNNVEELYKTLKARFEKKYEPPQRVNEIEDWKLRSKKLEGNTRKKNGHNEMEELGE